MADRLTAEQRHRCMAAIKGKDTKPEWIVRKYLHARGFRYRLHVKNLPGKPDIALRKYRTVIFINGCFWHGHENCKYYQLPKTNIAYWKAKIERNIARDKEERIKLRDMGWHVIQIWECQLLPKARAQVLKSVEMALNEIFLLNYKPMDYQLEDASSLSVAAEHDIEYSN